MPPRLRRRHASGDAQTAAAADRQQKAEVQRRGEGKSGIRGGAREGSGDLEYLPAQNLGLIII